MSIFLSKYNSLVDKKGRICIPASYRSILSKMKSESLIIYPSLKNKCLEVVSSNKMQKIINIIDNLEPFSAERDAFQTVILSQAFHANMDSEGRISIPKNILTQASILDKVLFVGKGEVFEIWNIQIFEEYLSSCRAVAGRNLGMLKW